ncbi:hypothetical protein GUITHDRAFT_103155 [Guillardia theta CCMP2712]|uniref:ATP synthase mitochondrial F1 complex assembly factor 2 n=1 Tax=Guillardia theta (strain CCMP2712) TaxID=905079 RepID=L1JS14_GUITC|nr:hypothetical protein GUITHDRAFT_103155 [Guillardia theta CCMP2712]EKX51237.1 hypothetical protein GUITHDRAFT_103155 [Guillardia theta CCMP2712]|eukprot:XP_005838217.1 hypothetical protein GUITHDRAFT_103155 [Guillardia theta CCMP2712]
MKKEEMKKKDVPLGMLKADGTSKRFYKQAGVQQVKQDCPRTGMLRTMWSLTLDGRGVRTPANKLLTVPTKDMAMAIAMEFDVQDLNILPYTMPLTTLATTSIDQISRSDVRQSTNDPPDLVEKEEKIWGRICDWAESHYKFKLVISHEWLQTEQPDDIMSTVRDDLLGRSDWRLTVIDQVAGSTGSLMLSLALSQGFLNADEAMKAARLSEDYNVERWGMVMNSGMGGHDIDAADMRSRLAAAWLYNRLLPTEYR